MKSLTLFVSLFVFSGILSAQVVETDPSKLVYENAQDFLPAASAIPFTDVRYVEAQGSAYFDQQWLNGTVITTDKKAYKAVPVRIDLYANKVHTRDEAGREFVVSTPLREVKYEGAEKSAHFLNGSFLPNKRQGWYQLLVNDTVSLIKSFRKVFEEKPSYGGNQLYIKTSESYFVYVGADEHPIKKVSDLSSILPALKAEVEAEAKRLKSSPKEAQLIGVIQHLNTLLKK